MEDKKPKAKKKKVLDSEPGMEYRPVFVQFIGVRKCRYNPSFEGFQRLPSYLQGDLMAKREEKHGADLPPLEISRKTRKRSG